MVIPWFLKNYSYHGNPLYPLGWGIFGGPEWRTENAAIYSQKAGLKGIEKDFANFMFNIPYQVTRNWEKFEGHNPGIYLGFFGFFALCSIVTGFIKTQFKIFRNTAFLLYSLYFLGFAVWFATYQSVRFLIPELILIPIMVVPWFIWISTEDNITKLFRIVFLICMIIVASWAPFYRLYVSRDYQSALGLYGEQIILSKSFNSWLAVEWLNKNAKDREPVFYIGEHRPAYARNYRPISSDWFDTPRVLVEIRETEDNQQLLDRWRTRGIRYVLLNQKELSLYELSDFKPRFSEQEWSRFIELRKSLLENVEFTNEDGVYILSIE